MSKSQCAISSIDRAMSSLREIAITVAGRMIEIDEKSSKIRSVPLVNTKFKT
jgi:hypothetical protein